MPNFIGNRKIKDATQIGQISTGENLLEVVYTDGNKEQMTEKMYHNAVSEKEIDATELRDKRLLPVCQEILTTLLNWGIKIDECDYLFGKINLSINQNLKNADEKLWNREYNKQTFFDVDRVLRQ